jgi:hypothetical protein
MNQAVWWHGLNYKLKGDRMKKYDVLAIGELNVDLIVTG